MIRDVPADGMYADPMVAPDLHTSHIYIYIYIIYSFIYLFNLMSSIYVVIYSFIHNYTYHMYVYIYIYIMQWDSLDTQSESFILIYL